MRQIKEIHSIATTSHKLKNKKQYYDVISYLAGVRVIMPNKPVETMVWN